MMPQSAGDKDASLDLSDIDIQQARTIHEAMEQKLSPEEALMTKLPQLAKRLSDGDHHKFNGSASNSSVADSAADSSSGGAAEPAREPETAPPVRNGVKFAPEPDSVMPPPPTSMSPADGPVENRRSIVKSVRMPVPKEVLEAAQSMTGRDISLEPESAMERALNQASLSRRMSFHQGVHLSGHGQQNQKASPKYVCGREICQDHEQYALAYGMMLGIRVLTGRQQQTHGLSNQSISTDRSVLLPEDFEYSEKVEFPPEGQSGPLATPPHRLNHTFKFKNYTPKVFRAVRDYFGIDEADYMLSLAGDYNYIEFIANSKSGQFFFYSHDGKYMIKTQTKEECAFLRSMLPEYYDHVVGTENTLMTRFYGMYRVKMKHLRREIHFVIMASVFNTPLPIHIQYDLKGSTVGRETSEEDKKAGKVQKDNDLTSSGRRIQLGPLADEFLGVLERDAAFLSSMHIMDYSLLIGIHEMESERAGRRHTSVTMTQDYMAKVAAEALAPEHPAVQGFTTLWTDFCGGVRSLDAEGNPAGQVYFMGIIDILQRYNARKRAEHYFKSLTNDGSQISAVDPASYARRFVQFLRDHIA